MSLFRSILILVLSCTVLGASAQREQSAASEKPINQSDLEGKKHGLWLLQQNARMGEPGFSEFGNYQHGSKFGQWYKIDTEGDLMAIENFRDDILDGEVKYYTAGRLTCTGNYRGLNRKQEMDTVVVVDPVSGDESLVSVPTYKGSLRHGMWKFYDPQTGKLVREEDYQVDDLVYHKDFDVAKEDSTYIKKREEKMPHNTKNQYTPPAGKATSYKF